MVVKDKMQPLWKDKLYNCTKEKYNEEEYTHKDEECLIIKRITNQTGNRKDKLGQSGAKLIEQAIISSTLTWNQIWLLFFSEKRGPENLLAQWRILSCKEKYYPGKCQDDKYSEKKC